MRWFKRPTDIRSRIERRSSPFVSHDTIDMGVQLLEDGLLKLSNEDRLILDNQALKIRSIDGTTTEVPLMSREDIKRLLRYYDRVLLEINAGVKRPKRRIA